MKFEALPDPTKAFVEIETQKAMLITDAAKYEQYLTLTEEQIKVGVMNINGTRDPNKKHLIENAASLVVDEIICRVSDKQTE